MKRIRKVLIGFVSLVIILVLAGVGIYVMAERNMAKLADMQIMNPDMAVIKDGTYMGSYRAFPIVVEVAVTVKAHQIIAVELLQHRHGQGAAAEIVPDAVVKSQSLAVDAISGATYSSKAILKAIENALTLTHE